MKTRGFIAATVFLGIGSLNLFSNEPWAQAPSYEAAYQKARNAYYSFKADKEKQKFRHNWQNLAKKFEDIAENYPDSHRVPDALFTAGRLYHELYAISRVSVDIEQATQLFRKLVQQFPNNHLADDAQLYIALRWVEFQKNPERAREELSFLIQRFPQGDVSPKAKRMLEDLEGAEAKPKASKAIKDQDSQIGKTTASKPREQIAISSVPGPVLEKIRHWSNPGYTRISLYTREKVRYKVGKLGADKKENLPPRLYIDLMEVKLGKDLSEPIAVRDSLVREIRFAPRTENFIRVVIDLDEEREHRVFPMNDPARVVVDISRGEDTLGRVIGTKLKQKKHPQPSEQKAKSLKKKSRPGASLSMLAGLKVKRVVIDPGHGGADPGAIGPEGTLEKEMALDISKRLSKIIKEKLKLEVLLTRKKDRFMALEARTAFANKNNADLFISIHLNAHTNRRFRGVEVFYLDLTNDRYSIRLAARENATSEKSISDLQYILADLALKSHVDDSITLSKYIQKGIIGILRRGYKNIRDLGVKPALFYVLIGARMPSILVEASFISNPMEEKRLRNKKYRQKLAQGIYLGIKNFIDQREQVLSP